MVLGMVSSRGGAMVCARSFYETLMVDALRMLADRVRLN